MRLFAIWDVVAECSPKHVVNCLGPNANGWHVIVAGPPALGKVQVLDPSANSTLRSLVEFVPEADHTFLDHAIVLWLHRLTNREV